MLKNHENVYINDQLQFLENWFYILTHFNQLDLLVTGGLNFFVFGLNHVAICTAESIKLISRK